MTHIEGRTVFRRSPADMFDFLADPRHEPQYNPLVVDAEKLTPGPIGPGTRFRQRIRRFGRTDEIVIDLVDAERPGRLAWRIDSAGMQVHGQQTVTATGDGSTVHWKWDLHLRGVLRLIGPLVGLAGRRLERRVWCDMQHYLDRPELSKDTSAPKGSYE